jgi:hypothetical protein
MGTDWKNVPYHYYDGIFFIEPTSENGLKKLTAFRKDPKPILVELLASLATMGRLGAEHRKACDLRTKT